MKLHVRSIYVMLVLSVGALFFSSAARAQLKIGSNPSTINKSSILELESDRQGLLLTRLTDTAQINTIMSTETTADIAGTIIYLDKAPNAGLYMRTAGGYWQQMSGTGQDSTYWRLTGNAGADSSKYFIGTTDAQPVIIKANNTEAIHITKDAILQLPTVEETTDSLEVLVIDPTNGNIVKRKALSTAAFENAIRFLNGLKNEGVTLKVDSSTSNPALAYTANAADSSINLSIPVVNDTTKTAGLLSYADYIKLDSAAAAWSTAFSTVSIPNGLSVDNVTHIITLGAADITNPGAVTVTAQSFAGDKTFTGNVVINGSIGVDGAASLNSTLAVTGKTTLTGSLEADSSATIKGDATLNGNVGSKLNIANIAEADTADGNTVLVRNTATGNIVEKDLQQSAYKQLQSGHAGTDINIDSSNANSIIVNVPYASTTARGLITDSTQTLGGSKTFADSLTVGTSATNKILTVNGKALVTDSLNVNGAVKLDSTLTLSATPDTAATGQNYVLVRDSVSGKVVQRKIDDGAFKTLVLGTDSTQKDLYIDSTSTLGKLIINAPDAAADIRGVVTDSTQTFGGNKTFQDSLAASKSLVVGDATSATHSTFQLNGSLAMNMTKITSSQTLAVTDNTILVDATSGAITVTLPNPSTITGRIYTIKKIAGGLDNDVTITPLSGTIDGGTSYIIYNDWTFVTLQTDGTNWYIIKK